MLLLEIKYVLLGTGITCLATALGSAFVFFFKKEGGKSVQRVFMGFAAGVMLAASVWSLLIPAMDYAGGLGQNKILAVGGGFFFGALFLMLLDMLIPHLHKNTNKVEGVRASLSRSSLLVLAVALHNLPEGMAVGIAFVSALQGEFSPTMFAGAFALTAGMSLQNVPEGAAISIPLRQEGMSRPRAFIYGTLTGVVEIAGGLLAALLAHMIYGIMPFILAFAAGAMVFVVVEEMLPENDMSEHSHLGTLSVMAGFAVMMFLDVLLG